MSVSSSSNKLVYSADRLENEFLIFYSLHHLHDHYQHIIAWSYLHHLAQAYKRQCLHYFLIISSITSFAQSSHSWWYAAISLFLFSTGSGMDKFNTCPVDQRFLQMDKSCIQSSQNGAFHPPLC